MAFVDMLGLGAAAAFGLGVGIKAFKPIIVPTLSAAGNIGMTLGPKAMKFAGKSGWAGAKKFAQMAPGTAKEAWGIGKFAFKHPYMTAGAIGAGALLSSDYMQTPHESPSMGSTDMSANLNTEAMAVDALNTGVSPMYSMASGAAIRNQRLMQSTMGLVGGLHRSRH